MFESLHDFEVLAKRLDLKAAAKDLALSQPTLSRHILSLEQELGVRLFDRRPLRLTQAGTYILENMIPLINEAERVANKAVDFAHSSVAVPLVASMIDVDSYCSHVVTEAAVKMKQLYPDFMLKFAVDNSKDLSEMVYSKAADLAFLLCKPDSVRQGFQCEYVMSDTFNLWVHKDNPILTLDNPTLSDLSGNAIIFSKNRHFSAWSESTLRFLQAAGASLSKHEKSLNTPVEFILNLLPDEVIGFSTTMGGFQPDAINPDLRIIPFDSTSLIYEVWALYPSENTHPYTKAFFTRCKQIAARS